ncbi:MAG: hypothetical protein ACRCU5_00670 [Rhizobiaceae bacterium]
MTEDSASFKRYPEKAFLLTPLILASVYVFESLTARWIYSASKTENFFEFLSSALPFSILFLLPLLAFVIGCVMFIFSIPFYILLRKLKYENVFVIVLFAVLISALIQFLSEFIRTGDFSFYAEGCEIIKHSVRTPCGWHIFWRDLGFSSLHAAFAGLVFWRVYAGKWIWILKQ